MLAKVHVALRFAVAAAFSALFVFITVRRALDRDAIGTVYAAGLSAALIWMAVRTFRRLQRS